LPLAASPKIIGQLQKGYGGNLGKGVSDRKESGGYRRPGGITKGGTDDVREIWERVYMKAQGIQAIGGKSGQRHKKQGLDMSDRRLYPTGHGFWEVGLGTTREKNFF